MGNRMLKDSICTSDKIASLTDFEFRLWVGLIVFVDDAGRGDARPAIIKGHVFPLRERVTVKEISDALHGLAAKGCVSLYTVGGKPYFWFPTWGEHQRLRDSKPKYPGPEDSDCGNSPQVAARSRREEETETNTKEKESGGRAATRFTPPTVEEVEAYIRERKSNVNARRFVDFYASKGWMVGKNPMKDWRAAIRTWEQRDGAQSQEVASSAPDAGELERMKKMREKLRAGTL